MADKKEKQYVSDNAQLMAEWHWEKNEHFGLDPNKLSIGSGQKAWWTCSKGHTWEAVIASRSRGSGCPYCSGRFAETGVNDFETVYPDLAKEWDFQKNSDLPSQTTCHSHKKVWWICPNGHSYQATVDHRSYGDNCPYCSGHRTLAGYNDIESTNPQLALEWNNERNAPLLPSEVTANSAAKVWWKCNRGHEWQAAIYSRQNGNGCPICSNKAVQAGFNDLATCNPELVKEWNYTKNGALLPTMVTTNSGKKVWWICSRGHEWESTVDHRTRGRGCPICLTDRRSSYPEQAIFYYLSKAYPGTCNRYKLKGKYELDIFVPEINIAIEYDGIFFHTSEKATRNEKRKNSVCYNEKILLIRIKEDKSAERTYIERWNQYLIKIIFNPERDYINLQSVLMQIVSILGEKDISIPLGIELERDKIEILALLKQSDVADNIEAKCPQIAAEWNYSRNGRLLPSSFAWASNKKVWWKCPKGHEYQAQISNRTVLGRKCPVCSNQQLLLGYNDLQTVNPQLASEWNYSRNGQLKPTDVFSSAAAKVWWICMRGHEWEATVNSRSNGNGCPYCSDRKILPGYNDFATKRPDLMEEWLCEKNSHIDPTQIGRGSGIKAWWKCRRCGNEWETSISNRVMGRGCPVCRRKGK